MFTAYKERIKLDKVRMRMPAIGLNGLDQIETDVMSMILG